MDPQGIQNRLPAREILMGVNLSIKNVPKEWVERLRERAKRHHRSLQKELLAILEEALGPRRITLKEAYERVRALGLQTEMEAVRFLREDRDAR
jgi:plasmid stability protein